VLRHRLVLSYEALADGLDADQLIERLMKKIGVPEKPLGTHPNAHTNARADAHPTP